MSGLRDSDIGKDFFSQIMLELSAPYGVFCGAVRGGVRMLAKSQSVGARANEAGSVAMRCYAVAQDARHYHRNDWGTAGSATLTINAVDVSVSGFLVENMLDYLSNDALPGDDENKIRHSQAAALLLDIESDRVHMRDVHLTGYQDTLFLNGGRLFFEDGFISGNVDFIFGNGVGVFEGSTIETRPRGKSFPEGEVQSYITAPSTQISQPVGLVFYKCRLTREEGVPDRSVTLGRPWHPTTRFADGRYADPKAIGYSRFIDTWMDAHIHENRWSTMGGTARDGSKSDIFRPEDSRFNEGASSGPGARASAIEIEWSTQLSYSDIQSIVFEDWVLGE